MTARQAYENYLATSGASQWLSWEGWQAAYAAGMAQAAAICEARIGQGGMEYDQAALDSEDQACADAIRAEIKGE